MKLPFFNMSKEFILILILGLIAWFYHEHLGWGHYRITRNQNSLYNKLEEIHLILVRIERGLKKDE